MAQLIHSHKSASINPLKMSAPLGGAMAFMGLAGCMPMLHGSQGCTAFGLVLLVRHFREAIPFQTTAMNEVTTILGGLDNIEQAISNVCSRAKPAVIGICSTGLVETRGEDIAGDLKLIRRRHPELQDTALVYASTPDFVGAFQDGWAQAVTAIINELTDPATETDAGRVNLLAGCHLTPGDLEELREVVEAFGLTPVILPDLSGSLDGHLPEHYVGTTFGGTSVDEIRHMGRAEHSIAIGAQMAPALEALAARSPGGTTLLPSLTGLAQTDALMALLSEISGRPVPAKYRRQRSQLVDAMLDGHFYFGGKTIVIGAEPDLLLALSGFLTGMGCQLAAAVTTTDSTKDSLAALPLERVLVGDLDDLEQAAIAHQADLIITHAHGRQASERTGIPLWRAGFPMFDRLGGAHQLSVGYRGSRDLIFALANLFLAQGGHHGPTPPAQSASLTASQPTEGASDAAAYTH